MKVIAIFCLVVLSHFSQAQIVSGTTLDGNSLSLKTSSGPSMWLDSSEYEFIKITLKDPIPFQEQINSIQFIDPYYSNVGYFSVKNGDCQIFPLKINHSELRDSLSLMSYRCLEGLFLIDDFDLNVDSILVSVTTHSGHMRQSQMFTSTIDYKIPLLLDSQIELVHAVATKKWYKRWVKDHSDVFVFRENYRGYYPGCSD